MDKIIPLPSDSVPDLQRTVQRKFGRCMLQLQQYERLLKAMVAHSEFSESQQFEIRKQSQADNGAMVVWYRSRPRETSKEQE